MAPASPLPLPLLVATAVASASQLAVAWEVYRVWRGELVGMVLGLDFGCERTKMFSGGG